MAIPGVLPGHESWLAAHRAGLKDFNQDRNVQEMLRTALKNSFEISMAVAPLGVKYLNAFIFQFLKQGRW